MTIVRGLAAAAMFAGLAVGGAVPAGADSVFSGHYNATETSSGGASLTSGWDVTPCGAGCVNISIANGGQYTAHLVNGQWQFGGNGTTKCDDGTEVVGASTWENYVDPNTLRGTSVTTYKKAGCGENLVGQTFTHTLVLTKG